MTWLAETAMLSHGWRRFLLLLAAGALGGLSVAPFFYLPLLFITLPLWVWCLDGAERRPGLCGRLFGPAFAIGFAYGLGYFIVALHWLGTAFFFEGGIMLALMPVAILALAAAMALFWGLASSLAHLFWSASGWRILVLATALAGAEYARGHVLTGFPFDLLGYALTANNEMLQLASVVGVYGLTWLCAVIAMTPALIWPADRRGLARRLAPFFLALALLAGQVGYGSWRIAETPLTERSDIKLRLVQPLIYEHVDWALARPADIITRLIDLSESRTGPDDPGLVGVTHVVWPESSLPFFLSQYPDALARIARMLPDAVMLLTGAPREEVSADGAPAPAHNSILAIDSDGEIVASYDKTHLVPFGEYLPFQDVFRSLGISQFVPGADGWAAGDGRRLLSPPDTPPLLALICYEAVFPGDLGEATRQAQFILNITNDAWFDGSIGPAQHFHHARLRAVEEGIGMVRVANSGITALVDPLGRVTARLPERSAAVLDVVPDERLPTTLYAQWRDLPFFAALGFGLVVALLTRRRPRQAIR